MRAILWCSFLAVLLLSGLSRAADRPNEADPKAGTTPKGDADKLVGTWKIVSGEKEGARVPQEHIQDTLVRISPTTIVVLDRSEKETYAAEYKVDTSKKPWALSMTATDGLAKGKTALGILLLEGNTLRLCYALPGELAPVEFATKAGSKQLLFVLERTK